MNERVGEIVAWLIRQFLYGEQPVVAQETLVRDLVRRGYSLDEIHAAFASVFMPPDPDDETPASNPGLVKAAPGRAFTPLEIAKISPAARGMLVYLSHVGLLQPGELEVLLLEAVDANTPEVGMKEIRWLLSQVIQDPDRALMATGGDPYFADPPEGNSH